MKPHDTTRPRLSLVLGLSLLTSGLAQAPLPRDLTEASLEQLANIQVTSVSRKEQALSKAGAAVYVITQEDIRRSGATNIPDLLRMAPGVDVAQIDANTYAISVRGFNDRLANKVLVLVDGRTVYTPTTSGVYWDQLDVPLEDIDRIEVIRGPGGTVWGANAANGVINIISLRSSDTQGVLVRAGGGSQDTVSGLIQYGGPIGRKGSYRVFENYFNTGNLRASNGKDEAADGWHKFHSGFRSDWALSPRDTLTVQGDFLQASEGQTISVVFTNALPLTRVFNDSVNVAQADVLSRWKHTLKNGSDTSLQVYYDQYDRRDEGVDERLRTVDLDFQHHLRIGSKNDVVWGFGYRSTSDSHRAGYGKTYIPLDQANNLFSTFFQDEIAISRSVALTLGSKFERQPYTGFQYEPSAQLVWTPTSKQTVWLSASRAIVETSREQTGLQITPFTFPLPDGGFGVAQYNGNPGAKGQRLLDFELGYRSQATRRFYLDVNGFSSHYHNLSTLDPGEPYFTANPGPPHLVLPSSFGNTVDAATYGVEVSATWNANRRWKVSPGYSAIQMSVHPHSGSQDVYVQTLVNNTPEHQVHLRSMVNITPRLEWDSAAYYVGALREGGSGPVHAYTRVDTRVGWRLGEFLNFSIAGQNLLTPRHAEFHDAFEVRRTLVARSIFAAITWRR